MLDKIYSAVAFVVLKEALRGVLPKRSDNLARLRRSNIADHRRGRASFGVAAVGQQHLHQ
jgi:hypothetical protein